MIIKIIPPSNEDTAVYQLTEPDMVVDPRQIEIFAADRNYKFEVEVNGMILAVTRMNREEDADPGWCRGLFFRVYSRNEFYYSFESTKYLYRGIGGERPPRDAIEIIVKDGVETIRKYAFISCSSLSKITIPDTVTKIENGAFEGCSSLQCIQLPPNLQYIGEFAFFRCSSLEAIYIPPTVTVIANGAFCNCKSLRIINIPDDVQYVGYNILKICYDLNTDEAYRMTTEEYLLWIRSRYNPLHNLCWDPSVTANNIQQYIQQHHDDEKRARTKDKPQFTPLHLLAANPSVNSPMITAYLQLAPDAGTMQDNIGGTPLHMLCAVPTFSDTSCDAMRAYLAFEEGRSAAFMQDDEGRTPFERLCEKGFDEMLFLRNKSFGGLMVWWYDCLGIDFFVEDVNKVESDVTQH